jgi:spermidine synthase
VSKKKIYGKIICRCRDGSGNITVADAAGIRSLSFGDAVIQSRMRLNRPDTLLMEYSQAMMSALVFGNKPESVLLIGLGGGSLVNFLLQSCPGASIDVVEISERIISLAHEYFFVPRQNAHLTIINAAGQDFIKQRTQCGRRYDLILVDAFDEEGPASHILEEEFLSECRQQLNEDGIFVVNLWSGPADNFPAKYARVKATFANNTLKLILSESDGNAVVFAFQNASVCRDLSVYRQEARRLQLRWGINFPKFFKLLYCQNFH